MSELPRGPERSSGPARTDRGTAAGSEDFYAAAAASVAARSGASNGVNGRVAAPAAERLTPQGRPAPQPPQSAPSPVQNPVRSQPAARNGSPVANPLSSPSSIPSSSPRTADVQTEPTARIGSNVGSNADSLDVVRPKSRAERKADREAAAAAAKLAPPHPLAAVPAPPPRVHHAPPTPAENQKRKPGAAHGTRKARLRVSRLDPWSVMKTSFLFSIAAGIVFVVAVFAVWTVIGSSGLFSSIDSIVGSVLQAPGDSTPFRIENYVNTQKVMGVAAFLACIDVVIITALATLGSFLYNLAATMLGGLEVTLAED